MTRKNILALMAGVAGLVVGGYTLAPMTGAEAQDRSNAAATARGLQSARVTDGGVNRREVLDEACGKANAAFDAGLSANLETGVPTTTELAQLNAAAETACGAIQVLRDKIEAARAAHEVRTLAYLCVHASVKCPTVDGGSP